METQYKARPSLVLRCLLPPFACWVAIVPLPELGQAAWKYVRGNKMTKDTPP